jgi:Cu/Ag efflux pump CusA
MIARLIRWSVGNRFLVLLATVMLTAWGLWALRTRRWTRCPTCPTCRSSSAPATRARRRRSSRTRSPTRWHTTMLSVPGAKTVRGFSFFGDSFVYVLFEDGTDLYWARSRVLEYLNQVQGRLPATARSALGPDATGVGWIYQYALVDRTASTTSGAAARAAGLVPQVRAEKPARTSPRWPPSAAWCAVPGRARPGQAGGLRHHPRWRCAAIACAPTRRPAARCWSWPRPSTWCAPAAI